jgi:hypothetical protein
MTTDRAAAAGRDAWRQVTSDADEPFSWVAIADTEVRLAQKRHPDQADLVYHAWPLLERPYWMPPIPFVYAGYIRELLDRVAAGQDTRPGTAAEIALACSMVLGIKAPAALAGVYFRAWVAAFPDHLVYEGQAEAAAWYEREAGPEIHGCEAELRRRLRQPRRRLPDDITCDGWHGHCRFATAPASSGLPAPG